MEGQREWVEDGWDTYTVGLSNQSQDQDIYHSSTQAGHQLTCDSPMWKGLTFYSPAVNEVSTVRVVHLTI